MDDIVPAQNRVDRLVISDPVAAGNFLDATLAAGHEGLMAKSLTAPYEAGRRGAGWLKVKPVHTLDLVVLAVEWGSGTRSMQAGFGVLVLDGFGSEGFRDSSAMWMT